MKLFRRFIKSGSLEKSFDGFLALIGFGLGDKTLLFNIVDGGFFAVGFGGLMVFELNGEIRIFEEGKGVVVDFELSIFDGSGVLVKFLKENFEFFFDKLNILGTPVAKVAHEDVVP